MFGKLKSLGKSIARKGLRVGKGFIKSIDLKKLAMTSLKGVIATNPYLAGISVGWDMLKKIEEKNPTQTFTLKETKAMYAAGYEKGRRFERNLKKGGK